MKSIGANGSIHDEMTGMSLRPAFLGLLSLCACAHADIGAPHIGGAPGSDGHWVVSWGASPQPGDPPLPLAGQTIRQTVRVTLGGSRVRVRLSNAEGPTAVHVGSAHLAVHGTGASIAPGSDHALTFGGLPDVTIPPGALLVSDPVDLSVPSSGDLAVSLYLPDSPAALTEHSLGQTTYVSSRGDFTGAGPFPIAKTTDAWYFLSGVEVDGPPGARAVVALGDSLTDGHNSTKDANHRWPSFLAERSSVRPRGAPLAVIDEGISGNCVLRDLVGASALARLDRDVLALPGVEYVIVLEGTNDIGATVTPPEHQASADEIIAGHRQIILRAHARGLKVFGGTLAPFAGCMRSRVCFARRTPTPCEARGRQSVDSHGGALTMQ